MPSTSEATIVHADLDAFFASVEQRDDPALRGRPVAVGGGVVLAASYEAKRFGVRGAMGGAEALRRCPQLVVVPPRFSAYVTASKEVFDVFRDTTPDVETASIDEAFLHVGGLRHLVGPPIEVARRLRQAVRDRTGLTITAGIARTRFLAKVASGVAKPDGLLLVPPDGEQAFLDPLPVGKLWGIGPASTDGLNRAGLTTVAEVARLSESTLVSILGTGSGRRVHALVHNRDPRPVVAGRPRRSIGSQSALGRPMTDFGSIDPILAAAVERVARRLRSVDTAGRTVVLRLRFGDFTRATRSHSLAAPTASTRLLFGAAHGLLAGMAEVIIREGLTLVGVSVTNLSPRSAEQLELPIDAPLGPGHFGALDVASDGIRDRFGSAALTRAVLLGDRSARAGTSLEAAVFESRSRKAAPRS